MRIIVAAVLVAALFAGCASTSEDQDDDRLPDAVESKLGLDSSKADSDDDGVPDAKEDSDGDGVSNEAEVEAGTDPADAASVILATTPADDAVVIAVIDGGFDPYHYDFLASQMPQALDDVPGNEFPLDTDPATWLPGYPADGAGLTHQKLEITLPSGPKDKPQSLHDADSSSWGALKVSTPSKVNMAWIPGTKVVGYVNFGGGGDGFSPNSHGVGTSSVSVGNLHGACPECLFVFVHGTSEEANRWVESQSWIDAQSNSWGISTNPVGLPRDRVYAGSDTESQRKAIERGQQIFFSAGNGLANDFSAPNPTLLSSQEGPDWLVTVGAVTPSEHDAYSGAGKPADIAAIGSDYPSAGGDTVTANSTFGGTSNATPVTTGTYGRALHAIRQALAGASRIQADGVIAKATSGCDATCDTVTVHELRTALYAAAVDPNGVINAAGVTPVPELTPELTFASFGHGVYVGRMQHPDEFDDEARRIADTALKGTATFPDDEKAWFAADSYCRQGIWGAWTFGELGDGSALPGPDPTWPVRTYYANGCPESLGTVRMALAALP